MGFQNPIHGGKNKMQWLHRLDYALCAALLILLAVVIVTAGMANVQTDAIDYYAIVQRLAGSDSTPLVHNLPFLEQRSPGYPILTLIPYTVLSLVVEPFVQTVTVTPPSFPPEQVPPSPAPVTEQTLIPATPLLFRELFFKDFYIAAENSWFRWKIIAAMLLTSYGLLFGGLLIMIKTLSLESRSVQGVSLAPLMVVTAPVLMHNIVQTPAYATLTALGISALFCYFFVKSSLTPTAGTQWLAGLCGGVLVLVRLETAVMVAVVTVALVILREWRWLHRWISGGLAAAVILLVYNATQFGTPWHVGILKGDINRLTLDGGYIFASLLNPQSGILIWSALISLGLLGLGVSTSRHAKILGLAALALMGLVLLRVPAMYDCVGQGIIVIGGLPITCPADRTAQLTLIRFDANRYVTVLVPFAVLGIRAWPALFQQQRARRKG